MTVEEAKAHQKAIIDLRNKLNEAIRIGHDAGVHSELEIHQITREQIGQDKEHYETLSVHCFINPTKLE